MIPKDDNELVYEVLQGSKSSFEVLIERYQKKIYGMILQMTDDREMAKDLTQDVFIKVYTSLAGFSFKYRFFSWLYRIAYNETMNRLSARRTFESLDKARDIAAENSAQTDSPESALRVKLAIRELKSSYRSLILLKYYFGLSYEEIAETLGISAGKVKDRLFNARIALRDKLNEKGFFDND
ncbi:MAG: sigma-70 family RNA polymerase sigma factor [Bacteroidetes bacterium]|nr:MAG: sigma-70 family RNA polymerase sigma factor [Bacteroidota bacterium]